MSNVMTLDELRADVRYWQRLMRFHGYACGAIDGIRGKQTRHAEDLWLDDAERERSYGLFDERTERNLATVCPQVQGLLRRWLSKARMAATNAGYEIKLIEGTRSYARQNELYAQGRTKKGTRVTNARGGSSWHNFGLAVDFGVFRGKTYVEEDEPYIMLGQLSRTIPGLDWGGMWSGFRDYPHVQLKKYSKVSEARAAFESLT